jgi:hypothetical protein
VYLAILRTFLLAFEAPAPGDYYEDGEFGGMMIGMGIQSSQRKPALMPLCPPQITHELTGHEPGPPQREASN